MKIFKQFFCITEYQKLSIHFLKSLISLHFIIVNIENTDLSALMKKVAVIDLGTNTCNLLIAEYEKEYFKILHQSKVEVKLAKDMTVNYLSEAALKRACISINKQKTIINWHNTSRIMLVATSAIREAKNGNWFIQEIKNKTGIEVLVISSTREAELIFKGVKLAFTNIPDNALIIDIGGGSNEFILTENNSIKWLQSFKIGVARAISEISVSDPIKENEITLLSNYFESGLTELWANTLNSKISCLIGCSGAFDTLTDLIDNVMPGTKSRIKQEINIDDFYPIYNNLIQTTSLERSRMIGIESLRTEMIIPAIILIKLVFEKLKIRKIYQTDYALREGVLFELILE